MTSLPLPAQTYPRTSLRVRAARHTPRGSNLAPASATSRRGHFSFRKLADDFRADRTNARGAVLHPASREPGAATDRRFLHAAESRPFPSHEVNHIERAA
jgi:hypothetical protein